MREDAINVIIYALLTFPSTEFDLETLVITIAPYATDQKKRVRQASMECLALLSQCLGPGKVKLRFCYHRFLLRMKAYFYVLLTIFPAGLG